MRLFNLRISDILSVVQELEPSQYEEAQMIEWLSTLDGEIWDEVVLTHVFPLWCRTRSAHRWRGDPLNQGIRGEQYPRRRPRTEDGTETDTEEEPEIEIELEPEEPGAGGRDRREKHRRWRWPYLSVDNLLIAGSPYGRDLYLYYLQSKIAYHNAEQAKYAIYSAAYNDAYGKFSAWYNRTFLPAMERGGNRLKF